MAHDADQVAQAYDALAGDYDQRVTEDLWMRRVLWSRYRRLFHAGERVLDVACGTGLDTLHLAGSGLDVVGIDASPGMIGQLRAKAERVGLAGRIETRVGDAAELDGWPAASFDGIVSAFAGLNTTDLAAFAAGAARLLRPGGRMIVHMLGPASLWKRLLLLVRGRRREARDLGTRRGRPVTIEGRTVEHALLPADETYRRYFATGFALRRAYALGFLWPQGCNAVLPFFLRRALGAAEPWLGSLPALRNGGRFFVLEMERRERV
jgi:SAM-dependent methyltransferase